MHPACSRLLAAQRHQPAHSRSAKNPFISHPGGWGQILAAVASFHFLSGQKKRKKHPGMGDAMTACAAPAHLKTRAADAILRRAAKTQPRAGENWRTHAVSASAAAEAESA